MRTRRSWFDARSPAAQIERLDAPTLRQEFATLAVGRQTGSVFEHDEITISRTIVTEPMYPPAPLRARPTHGHRRVAEVLASPLSDALERRSRSLGEAR